MTWLVNSFRGLACTVATLLLPTPLALKKQIQVHIWLSVVLHSLSISLCNDWAICFSPSWIKYVLLIILISSPNVLPPPPLNSPSGVQLRLEPVQPCHYLPAACLTAGKTFSHYVGCWVKPVLLLLEALVCLFSEHTTKHESSFYHTASTWDHHISSWIFGTHAGSESCPFQPVLSFFGLNGFLQSTATL